MIILFLSIFLIAGLALVIGSALAGFLDIQSTFDRLEDRALLSIWLGIVVLANCFLAISLVSPLTPSVTIGFAILASLLALLNRFTLRLLSDLVTSGSISNYFGITAVGLGVAAYCSQVIVWYDSGLYHIQFIKWLSEYGLVPGITLIHWRLGIASSWFALAAPFNHGILEGRVYSLTGAFCLFMLLTHFCLACRNILRRTAHMHDHFAVAALTLALPVILVWGMPNSPTPDFPVIALEIFAAWGIIAIATVKRRVAEHPAVMTGRLSLLILSAGAASMKLSAAPMVAVAYILYICTGGFSLARSVIGGVTAAVLLLPLTLTGIRISGCALFPSTFFCVETPSSLGTSVVAEKSRVIQEWAKWGGAPTPAGATDWNWLPAWFATERVCTALIILTGVSTVYLLLSQVGRRRLKENLPILAAGGAGLVFMLSTAPSWRFGLGYLVIIPALAAACHSGTCSVISSIPGIRWFANPAILGTALGLTIALHSFAVPRPSFTMLDSVARGKDATAGNPHFNLLLPPKQWDIRHKLDDTALNAASLFEGRVVDRRAEDFTYFTPSEDDRSEVCWDAPLPCAPGTVTGVRLSNRVRGIAGGFVKTRR